MDKDEFIQACREGGRQIERALCLLDRSFHAHLYREAVRALRDPAGAHDAVQEAFIRVWQRCASFRGESEVLPWIRAILRHTILDRVRKPVREVALESEDGITDVATNALIALSLQQECAPEDVVRRRQAAQCFARCWDEFQAAAPEHALVISWIAGDGLTNEEIAQLLGRSPGATREFISQCRKRARIHLAPWYSLQFERA